MNFQIVHVISFFLSGFQVIMDFLTLALIYIVFFVLGILCILYVDSIAAVMPESVASVLIKVKVKVSLQFVVNHQYQNRDSILKYS